MFGPSFVGFVEFYSYKNHDDVGNGVPHCISISYSAFEYLPPWRSRLIVNVHTIVAFLTPRIFEIPERFAGDDVTSIHKFTSDFIVKWNLSFS